jgi:plasmid stability protein
MAQVLIRNLKGDVVKALKKMSHEEGRSLQSELKEILERAAEAYLVDYKKDLSRLQKLFSKRRLSDSTASLRADRGR